jgi:hypothetical protein
VLTDYALAGASISFAFIVGRRIGPHNAVSGWLWSAAFVAAAIAGAAGGTYHGLERQVHPWTLRALWNVTMFSMGGCAAFLAAAVRAASIRPTDSTLTALVCGIGVTLFGVAVQQGALSSLVGQDPNPAYHLIQIVGLYFFFRAARTMRDRPGLFREPAERSETTLRRD